MAAQKKAKVAKANFFGLRNSAADRAPPVGQDSELEDVILLSCMLATDVPLWTACHAAVAVQSRTSTLTPTLPSQDDSDNSEGMDLDSFASDDGAGPSGGGALHCQTPKRVGSSLPRALQLMMCLS